MPSALTEPTGTGISPPVKPSVWRFGLETFFGYFCTVVICLPLAFALSEVGLDVFDGAGRGIFVRKFCPPGIAKLDAVWLRYTLLDGRHEQRIPLQQSPRVRCP